jgi:uncharacterized protein (DUF1330 family)
MKIQHALGVSFAVGLLLGSGAIFGLHAAAVPPAFVVVEVNEITNQQAFKEGYVKMGPAAVAEAKLADGRYLARTGTVTVLDGEIFRPPFFPEPRQSKAYNASMKELTATRLKLTKSRSFVVEGFSDRSP